MYVLYTWLPNCWPWSGFQRRAVDLCQISNGFHVARQTCGERPDASLQDERRSCHAGTRAGVGSYEHGGCRGDHEPVRYSCHCHPACCAFGRSTTWNALSIKECGLLMWRVSGAGTRRLERPERHSVSRRRSRVQTAARKAGTGSIGSERARAVIRRCRWRLADR